MKGAPPARRGQQQRHGPSGHIPDREILPASSIDSSPPMRRSGQARAMRPEGAHRGTPEAPRD